MPQRRFTASAVFTTDGLEVRARAYFNPGDTWNGWHRPHFPRAEVRKIQRAVRDKAQDTGRPVRLSRISAGGIHGPRYGGFRYVSPATDRDGHQYYGIPADTPDGPAVLYGLGAGTWCWYPLEAPEATA